MISILIHLSTIQIIYTENKYRLDQLNLFSYLNKLFGQPNNFLVDTTKIQFQLNCLLLCINKKLFSQSKDLFAYIQIEIQPNIFLSERN